MTTVFCSSNKDLLGSLAHDINALLDVWQDLADNGYGLYENWGDVTQAFLDGLDVACEWLPQSVVAKALGYTVMAAVMGAWLVYQLIDIAAIWWQSQGASYCLTLVQGGVVASVCAGVALCVVLGGALGVTCLVWRWVGPRVKVGLLGCGPVGEVFVWWLG